MMVQAKRIYIAIIKVNKFYFFSSWYFLKEIEKLYSLFLSNHRDTHGPENVVKHESSGAQHFSFFPTFTCVSTT